MPHFLPPEVVRQVNKLEWPNAINGPKINRIGRSVKFFIGLSFVFFACFM